jgi:hypothetical protein
MTSLIDRVQFVPTLYSADYGAGVDFDSINMKNNHSATFIIGFAAIAGDAVLTVNSGATNAALTTAETFRYAFGSAARGVANCDVLAATSTSAALTLTGTAYDNFMLIVEIEASEMTEGQPWLTANISSAGTSGIVMAHTILKPRYAESSIVSSIV